MSLPPTLPAAAAAVLRGRGIISHSCQPSALFGIMFLLGVILRLQESRCLYPEKQGGGGLEVAVWLVGWLGPKQIKEKIHIQIQIQGFVTLGSSTMFAVKLRITNNGGER